MEANFEAYDDDRAIAYMREHLPAVLQSVFVEDDIQYFLDVLFELEEAGEIDEEVMRGKMLQAAAKDGMSVFTEENLCALLDAENAYCKSIGLF